MGGGAVSRTPQEEYLELEYYLKRKMVLLKMKLYRSLPLISRRITMATCICLFDIKKESEVSHVPTS